LFVLVSLACGKMVFLTAPASLKYIHILHYMYLYYVNYVV